MKILNNGSVAVVLTGMLLLLVAGYLYYQSGQRAEQERTEKIKRCVRVLIHDPVFAAALRQKVSPRGITLNKDHPEVHEFLEGGGGTLNQLVCRRAVAKSPDGPYRAAALSAMREFTLPR